MGALGFPVLDVQGKRVAIQVLLEAQVVDRLLLHFSGVSCRLTILESGVSTAYLHGLIEIALKQKLPCKLRLPDDVRFGHISFWTAIRNTLLKG